MTQTCVIALERFRTEAAALATLLGGEFLPYRKGIFAEAFAGYHRIVAMMSTGIAIRSIAPLLHDKWDDPCVVAVSPDGRFAVPLTGGHHGGNDLAREIAEKTGAVAVISTATETEGKTSVEGIAQETGQVVLTKDSTRQVNAAILDGEVPVYTIPGPSVALVSPGVSVLLRGGEYLVGIGCRKGTPAEEISDAIDSALSSKGIAGNEVLAYATTVQKFHEPGLHEAVRACGGVLVFVSDAAINEEQPPSPSQATEKLGLTSVAESAALSLSKRKEIILPKTIYGRVTIAIIR